MLIARKSLRSCETSGYEELMLVSLFNFFYEADSREATRDSQLQA